MSEERELTVTDRAGTVMRLLGEGRALTTDQIVELCGYVDRRGADMLMMRLSRSQPIVYICGVWRIMET